MIVGETTSRDRVRQENGSSRFDFDLGTGTPAGAENNRALGIVIGRRRTPAMSVSFEIELAHALPATEENHRRGAHDRQRCDLLPVHESIIVRP